MKKIFTLLIITIPFLGFSQSEIQGEWRLSPVKLLRLAEDNSFHLRKGAFHHYGTYEVVTTNEAEVLRLNFETTSIDYEIISISQDELLLRDTRNNDIITANKKRSLSSEKKDVVIKEADAKENKPSESIDYKNHYKNYYPDNKLLFSIGAEGGISWASGPTAESQTVEEGFVIEEFSTTHLYSYGGSIKLGYQLMDGLYVGSGASYIRSGFIANRKASVSDPEYQFDAESSQSAKYTYSSIEVPLWANYRLADKWQIEIGGIASIPLRGTSRALFQGENTVWVNGEIDPRTSYESNDFTEEYPNLPEEYSLGGYVQIQRRLAKHLLFSVSYKYIKEYMVFDDALISNNMVHAGLTLQLF